MITNQEFLSAVFGADAPFVHVTDFPDDPNDIPADRHLIAWRGDWASRYQLREDTNQYFTISIFNPDDRGIARRRKALYLRTPVIVLDDVCEKLDINEVKKLPEPSWVLETSPGSEQWGYILDEPCHDRYRVENLLDGLVANGLAPDGRDPGMKGVTRYVRLPGGYNTKKSKMVNGQPFKCQLLEWRPRARVTLEQLATPFKIDLDAVRRDARVDGAAEIPDHPLLQIPDLIHIKEVRSKGRFDITCPWVDEHTGEVDNGTAIFTNQDGTMGFKCHHGACERRTGADLLRWLDESSPGFSAEYQRWQLKRQFELNQTHSPCGESILEDLFAGFTVSREVIDKMSDPDWLYPNLLIRGHLIAIPAPPNAGKTTLFVHLAGELAAAGLSVFYMNADISGGDAKALWETADESGFELLLPDLAKKSIADFQTALFKLLCADRDLSNTVIIIDTLKKMVDVINKKSAKEVLRLFRSLTGRGATIILLSHTNKYAGEDGKPIYEGTGDLRSDVDELIYLDSKKNIDDTILISTRPDKVRGAFEPITFLIEADRTVKPQTNYSDIHSLNKRAEQFARDQDVIDTITRAIDEGCENQQQIVCYCKDFGFGSPSVRQCLARYSSPTCSDQKWTAARGQKNALRYERYSPNELTFI